MTTKVCSKCEQDKPLSCYYFVKNERGDRVPRGYCIDCNKAYQRSPHHAELRRALEKRMAKEGRRKKRNRVHYLRRIALYPEKERARLAVLNAINKGVLVRPDRCERCKNIPDPMSNGTTSIQGHHPDYSKPLEVVWLCHTCHVEEHRRSA